LAKQQETTKQMELESKGKEYDANSKQYEMQLVSKKGDEDRKTMDHRTQHERKRADYKVRVRTYVSHPS
jgi:hypothetical protein